MLKLGPNRKESKADGFNFLNGKEKEGLGYNE